MGQGRKGQDHNPVRQPLSIAYPWPPLTRALFAFYARDQSYKQSALAVDPSQPSVAENGLREASLQAAKHNYEVQPQSSVPVGTPCLGKILRGFFGNRHNGTRTSAAAQ